MTEADHFTIELALSLGFEPIDDDATQFQCSQEQIVEIVNRARKQGRDDVAPGLAATREALRTLIEAAEKVRHWHDAMADSSGMVVSAESVRGLWDATDHARAALSDAPAPVSARQYAGDIDPHDDMARTLLIVQSAYGWTLTDDGRLIGLVAGDMGYASTSIVLDEETRRMWASVDCDDAPAPVSDETSSAFYKRRAAAVRAAEAAERSGP
ncbi:MAG: hypothetical protein K2Y29_17990 [Beijerinckiaceae bacterium]|nr:hypothetical protein [Beijerinckiaceae bacterium]